MSPTLRRLNLAGNLFFELSNSFSMLQLQELNLSYNKFEYFPNVILDIPTLEAISIHHNSLFTIPAEISKLKKLRHLNIAHNMLSRLPEELVQLENIKFLQIHGNSYIGSNLKILQALYELHPELEREMVIAEERDMEGTNVRTKRSRTVGSVITPNSPSAQARSPLSESPSTPTESGINEKRIHGLLEILESERKYTRYITLLYSQYYLPLTNDTPLPNVNITSPQLPYETVEIPDNTLRNIFPPGLVQIVNFNTTLLTELNQIIQVPVDEPPSPAVVNQSMIGPLFIERAPFLKLYTSYVSQYEQAYRTLSDCFAKNPDFKRVVDEGIKLPESNGLALMDLMIMPIQRIPRYLLLLQAVFSHTPSSHPDYDNLKKAMDKVQDVASYVNKKIEETSNRHKVIEIADELNIPTIIEPHRHFIREGKLTMEGEEGQREFKVYLLSDMIILKEFTTLMQGIRKYSINSILTGAYVRQYMLASASIVERDDLKEDEFVLQVEYEHREKVYRFAASSEPQRKLWVVKLKELINKARAH
jgi:hypothetical protein